MVEAKLRDLPAGAVVLVTGATDGIGLASAIELAKRGARVIVHGRSRARIDAAVQAVEAAKKGSVHGAISADFGSLDAVRAMGKTIVDEGHAIDALVNNAGVFMQSKVLTVDGFETTFAVNHLAPFLLTHLVLAASPNLARVVNVSSGAHRGGNLSMGDLRGEKKAFSPYGAYGTSKLANVLFTVELAKRVRARGIAVSAMHPGVISTKLLTEGFGMRGNDRVEDAAALVCMLALGPAEKIGTGRYFSEARAAAASPLAKDDALGRAFYEDGAVAVRVSPLPPVDRPGP